MTKEQFYLHTLADHWQEMGYPYAADLLRHHANEGVPAFREIVGGSPQVSERAPQGGGPVIFGTPDLGGGHNQAKLTFYHVHPDGQQQRLGSVGFARPEGHAVMRTLQAAGHKGAEIDAARTLPEGWKAPKAHQSFLPTLNTARPEAPEQDWRPNEVLPEDYYGYSRKRKYARTPAQHLALRVAAHLIATGWEKAGHKTAAALLRHAANKDDQTATGGPYFGIRDHHSPQDDHLTRQPGLPAVRATGGTSLMRESGHIFIDSKLPDGRVAHASVEMPIAQAQWLMRAMHREGTVRNDNGSVWSGWFKKPAGKKTLPDLDTTPPEAPEQDYRPNEMLPEDFYGYSRKRLARAKARHDGRTAARKLAKRLAREKPLTVPIHAILPDKENLEVAADSLHRGHRSEDTRPLEVYRVGKRFVLADGHHRLLQAILAGDTTATVSPRETDRPPGTKYTVPLDPDADLYGLPDRLPRNGWLLKRLKLGRRRKYSHRAFGEQMRAEPGNGTHPLVWADYLQEQGHDEAADIVREHVHARRRADGPYYAIPGHPEDKIGASRPYEPFVSLLVKHGDPARRRLIVAVNQGWPHPSGGGPPLYHRFFTEADPERAHRLVSGMVRSGLLGADHALAHIERMYPDDDPQPDGPQRMARPYRAPAGGTVVRGVYYEGGSMIPDLAGPFATGQTPSRPAPPPKSRKINWAAALRRWTGRQRNR